MLRSLDRPLTPEFTFAGFTFPRYIAALPGGPLAQRLADAKAPTSSSYYHAPKPIRRGAHPGKGFYLTANDAMGMRWRWADEISGTRIRHKGWYSDAWQDQTIRGIVIRLPHGRFLAGWSMGIGLASSCDGTIYTDEIEAAHAADECARVAAERERDYQEQWDAEQSADETETEE